MRSLLVLLATLAISIQGASAIAQGRFRALRPGLRYERFESSHRHATPSWGGRAPGSGATLFGFSFGTQPYGYDYAGYPDPYFLYPYSLDPWARGSFRAPDLLDDPYFYDRVPSANRYRRPMATRRFSHPSSRAPLALNRSSTESTIARPNRGTVPALGSVSGQSSVSGQTDAVGGALEQGMEALESLQQANEKLLLNLARYDRGDAWIEFLGCERMIAHAVESDLPQLRLLMARYDGVATDPSMRSVASIDGFDKTRTALRRYLRQPLESFDSVETPPAVESLPAPQPDPRRDVLFEGASEV